MIRKLCVPVLMFCSLYLCSNVVAQSKRSVSAANFKVSGKLSNLADSTVFLFYLNRADTVVFKTKLSHEGYINYESVVYEPTQIFLNTIGPGIDLFSKEFNSAISFWVEPGKITKLMDSEIENSITASGNNSQTEANIINDPLKENFKHQQEVIKLYEAADKNGTLNDGRPILDRKYDSIEANKRGLILNFITSHLNSYVSLSLIKQHFYGFKNTDETDTLFSSYMLMPKKLRKSYSAKKINDFFGLEGALKIGQYVKGVAAQDTNGKVIPLGSLKGNYVLVDFWASWCTPCRLEIPKLKTLYNKYKIKNFKLLSISLDTKKTNWILALRDEKMPWTNISELNGFNGLAKRFNILAIPYNFLIDPKGRVVAKNMKPEHLDSKLNSLRL